jgi:hypothetical protein
VLLLNLGRALEIFCDSNITGSRQIAASAESEAYDRKTVNDEKLGETRSVEHAFVIIRLSALLRPYVENSFEHILSATIVLYPRWSSDWALLFRDDQVIVG